MTALVIAADLMTFDNIVGLVLAVALTGFLMVALIFPERF